MSDKVDELTCRSGAAHLKADLANILNVKRDREEERRVWIDLINVLFSVGPFSERSSNCDVSSALPRTTTDVLTGPELESTTLLLLDQLLSRILIPGQVELPRCIIYE